MNCLLLRNKTPLRVQSFVSPCRQSSIRSLSTNKSDQSNISSNENKREFPVLDILPYGKNTSWVHKTQHKIETISPRYKRMSVAVDWASAWPAARPFHPATVPLPLHMSYVDDLHPKPRVGKFNNPELMKIPNFLHLTPPAIKRQCEALKKFCTKWPKGLETDEKCDRHFPITLSTKELVFSSQSIRWPDYRIVDLSLKLLSLQLNEHAEDKLKRLVRKRYNPETGILTIRADSCPLRKQNLEYAHYLLTAVYFESWKTEPWESEKEYSDWERYFWEKSESRKSIGDYFKKLSPNCSEEQLIQREDVQNYAKAVSDLFAGKETPLHLNNYKQSVLKLLF